MFVLSQVVLNPLVLWGCLRACAKEENEMQFLGSFFACTFALVAAIVVAFKLRGDVTEMQMALASGASFFTVLMVFVVWLSKASFAREILAVLLFCGFRFVYELAFYSTFVAPLAEASSR